MEKVSPKMAAAMGVGFFGFIMAAYSYNKYHTPDYVEEMQQNVNNEDTNDTIEKPNIKQDVTEAIKSKANEITKKIKEASGVHWGEFWKTEYNNMNDDDNVKIPEENNVPIAKPV
jgi:hypothetical protein